MTLEARYRGYIDCLNSRTLDRLGEFVDATVIHNEQSIGLAGYRQMLERDYRAIPDLHFAIAILVADDTTLASRLRFDCRPVADLFGLPVNGRRVLFHENIFYRFAGGKIAAAWSVIDVEEIRRQL